MQIESKPLGALGAHSWSPAHPVATGCAPAHARHSAKNDGEAGVGVVAAAHEPGESGSGNTARANCEDQVTSVQAICGTVTSVWLAQDRTQLLTRQYWPGWLHTIP